MNNSYFNKPTAEEAKARTLHFINKFARAEKRDGNKAAYLALKTIAKVVQSVPVQSNDEVRKEEAV